MDQLLDPSINVNNALKIADLMSLLSVSYEWSTVLVSLSECNDSCSLYVHDVRVNLLH